MRPALYLIGPSGAGKTTAIRAALHGATGELIGSKRFRYTAFRSGAVWLGAERGTFSGTDAFPLNVQPEAVEWVRATDAAAFIAEGDRLANAAFFEAARDAGFALTVAYLDVPDDVAQARRDERGSVMSAAFVKGRATKTRRLALHWTNPAWWIDGRQVPEAIAAHLRTHPAVQLAHR